MMLPELGLDPLAFPDPAQALVEPAGLLAIGGDLSPQRLIAAYRRGIFPWFSPGEPILWWSPDPRLVLPPEHFKASRSLRKRARHGGLTLSVDHAFLGVLHHCAATPRRGQRGTWIGAAMAEAYARLHRMGIAHSVEVWNADTLVGGLYGLALGRVFFGESMFSHVPDASKLALWWLCQTLERGGWSLIDCQVETAHLRSLGARPWPRTRFLAALAADAGEPDAWPALDWPAGRVPAALLAQEQIARPESHCGGR
jgi:leucyl/phenylalanyl-tRNA--protein transferase